MLFSVLADKAEGFSISGFSTMNSVQRKHLWPLHYSFPALLTCAGCITPDLCRWRQSNSSASTASILLSIISNSHRRQGLLLFCQGNVFFNQRRIWLIDIRQKAKYQSHKKNGLRLLPTDIEADMRPEANPMRVIWYVDMNLRKSNKCSSVTVMRCKLSAIIKAKRERSI